VASRRRVRLTITPFNTKTINNGITYPPQLTAIYVTTICPEYSFFATELSELKTQNVIRLTNKFTTYIFSSSILADITYDLNAQMM